MRLWSQLLALCPSVSVRLLFTLDDERRQSAICVWAGEWKRSGEKRLRKRWSSERAICLPGGGAAAAAVGRGEGARQKKWRLSAPAPLASSGSLFLRLWARKRAPTLTTAPIVSGIVFYESRTQAGPTTAEQWPETGQPLTDGQRAVCITRWQPRAPPNGNTMERTRSRPLEARPPSRPPPSTRPLWNR